MELDERKEKILKAIIQNYLETVDKIFVFANPNKKAISIQEFEKKEFDQLKQDISGDEDGEEVYPSGHDSPEARGTQQRLGEGSSGGKPEHEDPAE